MAFICASIGCSLSLICWIFFSIGPWVCFRLDRRFFASSRSLFTDSCSLRTASNSWREDQFHVGLFYQFIQTTNRNLTIHPCCIIHKQTTAHHPWFLLLKQCNHVQMSLLLIVAIHVKLVVLIFLLCPFQKGSLLIHSILSNQNKCLFNICPGDNSDIVTPFH